MQQDYLSFLFWVFIGSFAIVAIHNISRPAMLLGFLSTLGGANTDSPSVWTKPLYSCPACMASVWGSLFFVVFVYPAQFSYLSYAEVVPYWFLYCLAVSTCSLVLWLLIDTLIIEKDFKGGYVRSLQHRLSQREAELGETSELLSKYMAMCTAKDEATVILTEKAENEALISIID